MRAKGRGRGEAPPRVGAKPSTTRPPMPSRGEAPTEHQVRAERHPACENKLGRSPAKLAANARRARPRGVALSPLVFPYTHKGGKGVGDGQAPGAPPETGLPQWIRANSLVSRPVRPPPLGGLGTLGSRACRRRSPGPPRGSLGHSPGVFPAPNNRVRGEAPRG